MIMRPGQPLLLPANPLFIWASLLLALGLNMLINVGGGGRSAWVPDLLALTLVFWNVHQPLRIGVGVAFGLGVAMDVHLGALLGQHALTYTAMAFLAVSIHRRLLWFPVLQQTVQVLPLFAVGQVLEVVVRLIAGHGTPPLAVAVGPLIEALLWPLAHVMLLAPQRRPHDPDENRPL